MDDGAHPGEKAVVVDGVDPGDLAVLPSEVGDSADGWATDGGVVAMMVVAVKEPVKGPGSGGI